MLTIGDSNAILYGHDRINGVEVHENETQDFAYFMLEIQLLEAPSSGVFYS